MSPSAKWEYMKTVYERYRKAQDRKQKGLILDEFCKTYACHRKHALRLLNSGPPPDHRPERAKRGSPYSWGRIPVIMQALWESSGYLCGQRLKPTVLEWLPEIRQEFKTTTQEERLLLGMGSATIDRMLKSKKRRLKRRMYGTTKPGILLKHLIPIKTDCWDVKRPGFTEIDLVSHSGACAEGDFGQTLNMTDILTGWVERRCVMGKSEIVVQRATDDMRKQLPFDLLGIDSDNGSEFINYHLYRYCQGDPEKKRPPIQFTRSRPYKKDDNAHVEQKNWTHVRKLLGYGRYDRQHVLDAINDLYIHELRWFQNIFQPSMRLVEKVRVGSRIKRKYDTAKTPLRRVIESGQGDPVKLRELQELRRQINPFKLSLIVDQKLKAICEMASKVPARLPRHAVTKRQRQWLNLQFTGNDWPAGGPMRVDRSGLEQFRSRGWAKDCLLGTR